MSKDKKQPKSLKKKLIIWGIVLAFLTGLILYAIHLLNKPAVGVITQASSSSTVAVKEVATVKTLESDYFTLQYPGRYELQTNQNKSASLDSWTLIAHQALGLGQASKISVSVANLISGGIREESAYKHAEAFPEFYGISNENFNGEQTTILVRSDPSYERTILWPHGGYLLTISLTSGENNDKLAAELEVILQSVEWLK